MSEDEPTVPIVCDACDTRSRVPLSEAPEAVAAHNDRLHDGEDRAGIDPDVVERVRALAAEDILAED